MSYPKSTNTSVRFDLTSSPVIELSLAKSILTGFPNSEVERNISKKLTFNMNNWTVFSPFRGASTILINSGNKNLPVSSCQKLHHGGPPE